ncbi:hypothetical protein [Actinomadura latina]|uniref:Uncharacterized protein n=1 Tax=Actinomadura latina TaxID=163603 RepID=A0A846Z241_9ACTN|nr:hypothetical protein [Actinomadura latina]NKZ04874.1 hypothetical protein [Actinomadura latina]
MKDRMDAVPGAPQQPIAREPVGLSAPGEPAVIDEPGAAAVPVLRLTPVRELPAARDPWGGALRMAVTGATVLVITAELGRRAGAPGRLTAFCSAGACAVVVGPWLASRLVPQSVAQSVPQFA